MKKIIQTLTILFFSFISFNSYGWGFNSSEKFSSIFFPLVVIGMIFTLISYLGFLSSDKKGRFFSENNLTNGLLIITLLSIVGGTLVELSNGKFGGFTVLLLIYGLVFYFGNRMNKK